LRAMQGLSSCLLHDYAGNLDENGRDWLSRIATAAKRMDCLTQDLLTFSQFSQSPIELEAVSLELALNNALGHLEHDIQQKQAAIQVARPLPSVTGHVGSLEQIFINLLSNAVKFVKPGIPPLVEIWACEERDFLRVHVKDNGIGIAPNHHERIFKMFERLHVNSEYPGTGMGLAIVHRSVSRMKGRCGVKSQLGGGSCFWFELPRPEAK
jgi:signal transduction histidine kinase